MRKSKYKLNLAAEWPSGRYWVYLNLTTAEIYVWWVSSEQGEVTDLTEFRTGLIVECLGEL